MERKELKKYLVSLVGPLRGFYLRVDACNEDCVRRWADKVLGPTWCSVYLCEDFTESRYDVIGKVEVIWNYGEVV